MIKIGILGSGASAIAAAAELAEFPRNEIEITILDFGRTNSNLDSYRTSDFSYKESANSSHFQVPSIFSIKTNNKIVGSAGFGGWAEIWGATIVPYSSFEIENNFLNLNDFKEHENKVLRLLKGNGPNMHNDSSRYVTNYARNIANNKSKKYHFEISNLAISTLNSDIKNGCSQCGDCLKGCPENHVWKPSKSWPNILKQSNFRLISGVWIKKVKEGRDSVEVILIDENQTETKKVFDHIFCGLGAIQTAALLNRSRISKKVQIKDSQMVIVPFINPLLKKTGTNKNRIALSELFLYSKQNSSTKSSIFCQIYGSSPSLKEVIFAEKKFLGLVPTKFLNFMLARIGIAMCFLDQKTSGEINLTIDEDTNCITTSYSLKNKCKQLYYIFNTLTKNRMLPLIFLSKFAPVGGGYHFGASFPTSAKSRSENHSDFLGRPNGMNYISLIDSSTLTEISATPCTVNVMIKSQIIVKNVLKTFSI